MLKLWMGRAARSAFALGLSLPLLAGAADYPDVDLKRAEEINMAKCFLCHGMEGESNTALFPRIAGQHYRYTAKQLAAFQTGQRQSTTMASMVADLSPEEMLALGVFFEKKPTAPREVEDVQMATQVGQFVFSRGNEFSGVPACASCHGERGLGTDSLPRLAGQVPQYTEQQLKDFGSRVRVDESGIMYAIASKLTPLEMRAVAKYIATLD